MPKKYPQSKIEKVNNYKFVSRIYDYINRKIDYDIWAVYLVEICSERININSKILELGAGTSKLAKAFQRKYKFYYPTDLSKEMLLENKLNNQIVCSMLNLPFNKKFDIVISAFDSVNYLLRKKDLSELFCQVKKILKDDGIFLFDVSLEANSYVHTSKPIRKGNTGELKFIQKSSFNSKNRIHTNEFIINDKNGNKFKEIHKEKIYPFFDYFPIIEKAGLYVEYCFEAFTFENARENSERAQFVVKKK